MSEHDAEIDAPDDLCRLDEAGRCSRTDHDHSAGHPMEQTPHERPRLRVLPGYCDCPIPPAEGKPVQGCMACATYRPEGRACLTHRVVPPGPSEARP